MVRRSAFDQWLATERPLVAELVSHLRKGPARSSVLRASPLYSPLYRDSSLCHEAMPWLDHNKFASPAAAWDACDWGDGMLYLLERTHPLTEEQWQKLEQAQEPFWTARHRAQSRAEIDQANVEYQRATACALRQIVGNPWKSKNGNTSN